MEVKYGELRKKLRQNRSKTTAVNSKKLHEIISEIDKGEIQKPDFQRGYEWSVENVVSLINSILKGSEYGIVSLFSSDDTSYCDNSYVFPKYKEESKINYIADGLQRLTTLYCLYKGKVLSGIKFKNFKINTDDGLCIYTEDDGISIFDALSFNDDVDMDETGRSDLLYRLKEMFDEADVHYVNNGDMSYDKAISYFITKNTSSKALKIEVIMKAEYKKNGIDIQKIFDESGEVKKYINSNLTRYLKLYTPMLGFGFSESEHRKASSKNTIENITAFNKHFLKSIRFLKSIGFKSVNEFPYYNQFEAFLISSFLSNEKMDNQEYKDKLIRFLISTTVTERYSNSTSIKVREDISNRLEVRKFFPYTIERIQDLKISSSGVHQRLIKWFLNFNGVSFATGTSIISLIQSNVVLDKHHIFPRNAIYEKSEFKFDLDNIMNLTMIEHSRNRGDISNKKPSVYLSKLNEKNVESNIVDIDSMRNDNYDEFVLNRLSAMNSKLASYFN